jgi:L-ribulokinase
LGSDYEAEYYPQTDKVEAMKSLMESYDALSAFVESITKK